MVLVIPRIRSPAAAAFGGSALEGAPEADVMLSDDAVADAVPVGRCVDSDAFTSAAGQKQSMISSESSPVQGSSTSRIGQ